MVRLFVVHASFEGAKDSDLHPVCAIEWVGARNLEGHDKSGKARYVFSEYLEVLRADVGPNRQARTKMHNRIEVLKADITTLNLDTIVNAANSSLLGGGGVDGAIHRAAGPQLLEECRALRGCPTGQARITLGYKLPAKYVIHTVGPVWNGGGQGEAKLLALCYRSSLRLAVENSVKTIAFPAISCGIYGYPVEEACTIAVRETSGFLAREESIEKVIFACFGEDVYQAYARAMNTVFGDET